MKLLTRHLLICMAVIPSAALAAESPWSGSIGTSASTNIYQIDAYESQKSLSLDLYGNYQISEDKNLSLSGSAFQDLDHGNEDGITNLWLTYKHSNFQKPINDVKFSYQLGLQLPTSETANSQRKYAVLRLAVPISYTLKNEYLGCRCWSLSFTPRIDRNFYERTTPENGGKSYTEFDFRAALSLTGKWTDHLSTSMTGYLRRSNPFNDGFRTPRYGIAASISYSLPEDFALSAGYSNQNALYDSEQGNLGNFDPFDRESTEFYLSLEKSL